MPSKRDRRNRVLADMLAELREDVDDLKQQRPQASAITRAQVVDEVGVGLGPETVNLSTTTDPVFTYDDVDRGYDASEWGG